MEYRHTRDELITTLSAWDQLIPGKGKIHLIACGGTALTLLGYKPSTKDVDLLVPVEKEYEKLIGFLQDTDYQQVGGHKWRRSGERIDYDIFRGNTVFTTELPRSPLAAGGNKTIREFNNIYLGVLNSIDLIITKLARGDGVDFDDCLTLLENENLDLTELEERYKEAAKHSMNYGTNEDKAMKNFSMLMRRFKESQ